jgi:glucose uptake protein GlcU
MNVDSLIIGLIAILLGLIGLTIESRKSAKENKERGWNYTRTKFILGIWTLILAGTVLTIIGLLGQE